jgi:hypothetical protein
MSREELFQKA